ncbi:unnamed protein product [Zymoseptoria tritici ST99CH_3D1]|uniref:Uncharacterized protein n=1 Tax=Zymoseptoria tritici (strain ST99CH_3D7) TaxID=1276538 RepID=A0A1X7RWI7_ZYMT9|nr:unnamed protein product [Zymoseptoria tritici ST99CH_3D7]SMR56266.1 unnamed protein product [Zymoseptoria tritici ST99CH_3D1]
MPSLNQLLAASAILLALPVSNILTNAYPNDLLQQREADVLPRGVQPVLLGRDATPQHKPYSDEKRDAAPNPASPTREQNEKRNAAPQHTLYPEYFGEQHIDVKRDAAPAPTQAPDLLAARSEEECTPDDPCDGATRGPRSGRGHRHKQSDGGGGGSTYTYHEDPPRTAAKNQGRDDGRDPPNKRRAAAAQASPTGPPPRPLRKAKRNDGRTPNDRDA